MLYRGPEHKIEFEIFTSNTLGKKESGRPVLEVRYKITITLQTIKMKNAPEIKDIDRSMLTSLVRQALSSPTAEIDQWEHEQVSYINTEESNLGLHRFRGTAVDKDKARPWSMVLKAVRAPINETNPAYWNYHRREILAYQSGLLNDLPGGFSAPRCLGTAEYSEGVCWLWLEDLNPANRPWTLAEYGLAARHLGRFNGAYAAGHPLPVEPWLSQHWVRGWLAAYEQGCLETLELMRDPHLWEHPLLVSAFPRPITDDMLRMWDSHEALLSVLDQLPQTFCHMDAYRPNLFIHRDAQGLDQTVAVDWVFAGIGAIGEEIANLWAASLIWLEYDAAQAQDLDDAVFTNYLDGLREAGWQGDPRLPRLGYTAACALRWGVIGLWWLDALNNAKEQADFEKHWNRPMPELVSQWAKTAYHVLDLADEAYRLRKLLF